MLTLTFLRKAFINLLQEKSNVYYTSQKIITKEYLKELIDYCYCLIFLLTFILAFLVEVFLIMPCFTGIPLMYKISIFKIFFPIHMNIMFFLSLKINALLALMWQKYLRYSPPIQIILSTKIDHYRKGFLLVMCFLF